jgi:hypothetical protein
VGSHNRLKPGLQLIKETTFMRKRMTRTTVAVLAAGALFGYLAASRGLMAWAADKPSASPSPTPSVLPRPDFHFPGNVGRTYLDSDPPQFPQPVQAPKGAPNIVLILIDDAGFGQFSTFGGGVPSPTMDKLAAEGLRYNRFHTTALLQPDAGRAHHRPQSPILRVRQHLRSGHRLRRLHLRATADLRHRRRGTAPKRIHDRLDRQEPQYATLGDQRRWPIRPLGERARV